MFQLDVYGQAIHKEITTMAVYVTVPSEEDFVS